jgi:hypothetical protein
MSRSTVLAPVFLALLSARPCLGQTAVEPVSIEWNAPAGCPSYADVSSWLEAVLPPEVKGRLQSARATVAIEAKPGGGFVANIRVLAGAGERERQLEGPSCEELGRSAVIVVSVALTEAVNEKPKQEPPPAAAPEPAPPVAAPAASPAPERDRAPAATPDPSLPTVTSVAGGVSSGFGAATLRVDLAARLEEFALGGRLRAVPAASVDAGASDIALSLAAVGPEGCLIARALATLHLGGCARAELGILRAAGSGEAGLSDGALWSAVGALPFIEWGGSIRLLVAADLEVRLLRPTLELDDGTSLERLPRVAYAGLLGLSAAIP